MSPPSPGHPVAWEGCGLPALSREERMKYEVAQELGLLPKLQSVGWAGLSTAESGRIGGIVGARIRQRRKEEACTLPSPASTTR